MINLFVDHNPHAYVFLSPVEESKEECSVMLLIHAGLSVTNNINDANLCMKKSVHTVTDDNEQEMKKMMKEKKVAPVGIFSLNKISAAFHAANNKGNKPYDLQTNNCGVLLINMGSHLGIDHYARPDIVDYIQNLLISIMDVPINESN